jgi:hypothetical protein
MAHAIGSIQSSINVGHEHLIDEGFAKINKRTFASTVKLLVTVAIAGYFFKTYFSEKIYSAIKSFSEKNFKVNPNNQ